MSGLTGQLLPQDLVRINVYICGIFHITFSVKEEEYPPLQVVQIFFDTATFDEVARDTKDTLATQV